MPARVPTPTRSADSEFTSGRLGAVDDVIASAVERARGFTPARATAFATALEPRCWIAVDRLADDAQVRRARPRPPVPFRNLPPAKILTRRLPSERFSRFSWAPSLSNSEVTREVAPTRRARAARGATPID